MTSFAPHTVREYAAIVFFALCFFFLFLPGLLYAQVAPSIGSVDIIVTPEHPRPGEQVSVTAQSFLIDLDRATLLWQVNGRTAARGVGIKSMSTTAGQTGSVLNVTLTITTAGGTRLSAAESIAITDIDLLWHAITYTPPFYAGKALPAADASVLVAALPHFIDQSGRELAPETLMYTWRRDTTVLGEQSGRGRQSVTVQGPKAGDLVRISVAVSSADRRLNGSGIVTIEAVEPKVLLYRNEPLLGIRFEQALGETFALQGDEEVLTAYPYFASATGRSDPSLTYTWSVNGARVPAMKTDAGSIVLRRVGEGSGTASLSLTLQNLKKILQSAVAHVAVSFGTTENNPAFPTQ